MAQTVIHIMGLPDAPLDAAAHFYADEAPIALEWLKGALPRLPEAPEGVRELDAIAFVFPPAGKEHDGWRLAAIQTLAREAAPKRVNGVVGPDSVAVDEATGWLASADGITGQLLSVQTG